MEPSQILMVQAAAVAVTMDPHIGPGWQLNRSTSQMTDRPLVLIVDDDRDNREGYAEYLGGLGFRVCEAGTGTAAVQSALRNAPNIILMDLELPELDGWEITRRLKSEPATQKIPIIAVSAHVFPSDITRAYEAGCARFLKKPCDPETVVEEIRTLLNA
jgi:CheY-like chemotaxis protein